MTGEVRVGLRAAGKLGKEKNLVVHEPTQWTGAQRADVGLYQPGMIVSFRQDGAGAKRGLSVTVEAVEGGQVRLANGGDAGSGQSGSLRRGPAPRNGGGCRRPAAHAGEQPG